MQAFLVAFVVALAISYFATPWVKKLATVMGAMDAPNARKVHKVPIPRMGGLAIYCGFVLAVLASMHMTRELAGVLLGGSFIVFLGLVDDRWQLSARVKLVGQILAALILVAFGVRIDCLSNPFGEMIDVGILAIPLTVFWVVSLTNTVNLIDGLDGLAAGVSAIAGVTIMIVALQQNFWIVAILTAALCGATCGFLKYNFNPAKIFMGDTGSMFLGYTLAAISILGTVKSAATIALIVPIMALGLPIMDTAFAIIRRYLNGRPIFKPDKGHLHHRLLALGLSQKQAVWLMYSISSLLGLAAIILTEVNRSLGAGILVCLVVVIALGAKKVGILTQCDSVEPVKSQPDVIVKKF